MQDPKGLENDSETAPRKIKLHNQEQWNTIVYIDYYFIIYIVMQFSWADGLLQIAELW